MAQCIKTLSAKTDNLHLRLETHVVKRESRFLQVILGPFTHAVAQKSTLLIHND